MATIGTGPARGGRRELNQELALVPFIDFLLCLVAFLLVTAVWSQLARIRADGAGDGAARHGERQRIHAAMAAGRDRGRVERSDQTSSAVTRRHPSLPRARSRGFPRLADARRAPRRQRRAPG